MTTYSNPSARQRLGVTDTIFQNYVTDMHTLFTSSGWAVASDTGQLNEATVTMPALYTYAVPRMYYLNDSLHSTYPIYLKVEYGAGSTQTWNAVRVTVGGATNGAGSIAGAITTPAILAVGAGNSNDIPGGSVAAAFGSYGDGYSNVVFSDNMYTSASPTPFIGVSREFDQATGTLANNGNFAVLVVGSVATNQTYSYCWVREYNQRYGGSTAKFSYPVWQMSNPSSTMELSAHYARFPYTTKLHTMATYAESDSVANQTFTTTILGSTPRTYRTLSVKNPSVGSGFAIAMLWD